MNDTFDEMKIVLSTNHLLSWLEISRKVPFASEDAHEMSGGYSSSAMRSEASLDAEGFPPGDRLFEEAWLQ